MGARHMPHKLTLHGIIAVAGETKPLREQRKVKPASNATDRISTVLLLPDLLIDKGCGYRAAPVRDQRDSVRVVKLTPSAC